MQNYRSLESFKAGRNMRMTVFLITWANNFSHLLWIKVMIKVEKETSTWNTGLDSLMGTRAHETLVFRSWEEGIGMWKKPGPRRKAWSQGPKKGRGDRQWLMCPHTPSPSDLLWNIPNVLDDVLGSTGCTVLWLSPSYLDHNLVGEQREDTHSLNAWNAALE